MAGEFSSMLRGDWKAIASNADRILVTFYNQHKIYLLCYHPRAIYAYCQCVVHQGENCCGKNRKKNSNGKNKSGKVCTQRLRTGGEGKINTIFPTDKHRRESFGTAVAYRCIRTQHSIGKSTAHIGRFVFEHNSTLI